MHTVSPNDRRVEPWMSRFIELRNKSQEWNDDLFFLFFLFFLKQQAQHTLQAQHNCEHQEEYKLYKNTILYKLYKNTILIQ